MHTQNESKRATAKERESEKSENFYRWFCLFAIQISNSNLISYLLLPDFSHSSRILPYPVDKSSFWGEIYVINKVFEEICSERVGYGKKTLFLCGGKSKFSRTLIVHKLFFMTDTGCLLHLCKKKMNCAECECESSGWVLWKRRNILLIECLMANRLLLCATI